MESFTFFSHKGTKIGRRKLSQGMEEKKYFHLIALCFKDWKYEMGFAKVYSHDTFNLACGLFWGFLLNY